jgi:hypothetical protein
MLQSRGALSLLPLSLVHLARGRSMEPDAPRGSGHEASYDGRYAQSGQGSSCRCRGCTQESSTPTARRRGHGGPWHRHGCAPEVLLLHVVRSPFPCGKELKKGASSAGLLVLVVRPTSVGRHSIAYGEAKPPPPGRENARGSGDRLLSSPPPLMSDPELWAHSL